MEWSEEKASQLLVDAASAYSNRDGFEIIVKTELSPLLNLTSLSSHTTIHHLSSPEFTVRVRPDHTIWSVKVLVSKELGNADGFEPFNLHLLLPDRLEMRNDGTVGLYDIPEGSSILCVPEPPSINTGDGGSPKRQMPKAERTGSKGFLQKRKEHASTNTYASGRGLTHAIAHYASTIFVHPITKTYKPGFTADDKFAVEVRDAVTSQVQVIDATITFQKVKGIWSVSYTVKVPGRYKLDVTLGGQSILHSPFDLTVCAVPSLPFVLELMDKGWVPEATRVVARYALDEARRDSIVEELGVEAICALARSTPSDNRAHIKCILSNVLRSGISQFRFLNELDVPSIFAIADTLFWRADEDLGAFIGRLFTFSLQRSREAREQFVERGLWLLDHMWEFRTTECTFYCTTIVLLLLHSGQLKTEQSQILEMMWEAAQHFPHSERVVIQCLRVLKAMVEEKWSRVPTVVEPAQLAALCSGQSVNTLEFAMELACGLLREPHYRKAALASEPFIDWLDSSIRVPYEPLRWEEPLNLGKESVVNIVLSPVESSAVRMRVNQSALVACDVLFNASLDDSEDGLIVLLSKVQKPRHLFSRVSRLCGVEDVAVVEKAISLLASAYERIDIRERYLSHNSLSWALAGTTRDMIMSSPVIRKGLAKLCALLSPDVTSPFGEVAMELAQGLPSMEPEAQADVAHLVAHVAKNTMYGFDILESGGSLLVDLVLRNARRGLVALPSCIRKDDVEVGDLVASGPGSKVYRATWQKTTFALKQFDLEASLGFDMDELYVEVALGCTLQHKRIVHCVGGNLEGDRPFILFKWFERGSISDAIEKCPEEVTEARALSMALDVAQGMEFLHSLGIVHRDLKPGNLFVSHDWRVSVGDFGISRCMAKKMTSNKGTPQFMAPEMYNNEKYDQKSDVYSFAMVLWCMLEKKIPFDNMQAIDVLIAASQGQRPEFSSNTLKKGFLGQMAQRCWAKNPRERPTFTQVVKELREFYDTLKAHKRHRRRGSNTQPIFVGSPHGRRKQTVMETAQLAPLLDDVDLERSNSWDMDTGLNRIGRDSSGGRGPLVLTPGVKAQPDETMTDVEIAQFRAPGYLDEMKVTDTSDRLEEMDVPDDDDEQDEYAPVARRLWDPDDPPFDPDDVPGVSPVVSPMVSPATDRKRSSSRDGGEKKKKKQKKRSHSDKSRSSEDSTPRRRRPKEKEKEREKDKDKDKDKDRDREKDRERDREKERSSGEKKPRRTSRSTSPMPMKRKRSGSWNGERPECRVSDDERPRGGSWNKEKKGGSWNAALEGSDDDQPPGLTIPAVKSSSGRNADYVRTLIGQIPTGSTAMSRASPSPSPSPSISPSSSPPSPLPAQVSNRAERVKSPLCPRVEKGRKDSRSKVSESEGEDSDKGRSGSEKEKKKEREKEKKKRSRSHSGNSSGGSDTGSRPSHRRKADRKSDKGCSSDESALSPRRIVKTLKDKYERLGQHN